MKVVITGATKGIGNAMALAFAKAGFDLAICSRNIEELKTTQTILEQYQIQVLIKAIDASIKQEVILFAEFVRKNWKEVDILINNVGVYVPGTLQTEKNGTLEKVMNTNLYSAYYLTKSLLPSILKSKKGHIFNICSVAGLQPMADRMSYTISKYAMRGFSETLREELKSKQIKVTTVYPSSTLTAAWKAVSIPKERFIDPNDIAKMILEVYQMSKHSVVEELVIRPQLGDL